MLRNKKAKYFIIMVVVGLIIAQATMLIYMFMSKSDFSKRGDIGEKQNLMFSSYQDAEKSLFYVDMSAKWAADEAFLGTALMGGFPKDSSCQEYLGFPVWELETGGDKNCLPEGETLDSAFTDSMNEILDRYFKLAPELLIPTDNYDVKVAFDPAVPGKSLVTGDARVPLNFDIKKKIITPGVSYSTYTAANIPAGPVGKGRKEQIISIISNYGSLISEYCAPKNVPSSLMVALIVQESGGNPLAISSTGCAGLNQFCHGTAKGYPQIFTKLTPCGSHKTYGTAACNAQNDDRFDPEKSINAGCQLVGGHLSGFGKYSAKAEFALASYNGGSGSIKAAIKKTGEDNPSWQTVALQITPELLADNGYSDWTYDRRVSKVKEITNYVNNILPMQSEAESQLAGNPG